MREGRHKEQEKLVRNMKEEKKEKKKKKKVNTTPHENDPPGS